MKKLIILVVSLLAAVVAQAQKDSKSGAVLTFEQTSVDFGDLVQGDTVSHVFKFTNTGNEPLVLSEVITTCGCTAPIWTRAAIAPGKTGEILIRYNSAGKMGVQNKVVTVISNATNANQQSPARLSLRVNVIPPKK
ncbi:MAG TPA: DUF1573 domain-containing protein [Cytophagaceae bacterium]